MPQLTQTNIEVYAQEPSSLTFLLLQTHLSTLITNPTKSSAQSIDKISFELYQQYLKTKEDQQNNQTQSNTMLNQCSHVIQDYKSSQEALIEVSQDRLRLVKELKETTDEALELMDQNEKLNKMIALLSDLNKTLTTQNESLQTQLTSLHHKKQEQNSSIKTLSSDYQEILSANVGMKKQMDELSLISQKFEQMSLPIRMIKVAFNSDPSLRELVLKQAEKELGCNAELRQIFSKCKFNLGEVLVK